MHNSTYHSHLGGRTAGLETSGKPLKSLQWTQKLKIFTGRSATTHLRTPIPKYSTQTGSSTHLFQSHLLLGSAEGKSTRPLIGIHIQSRIYASRICPGNQFAESMLFITMSTMLYIFDLKPFRNEKGREVLPEPKMGLNLMVRWVYASHFALFSVSVYWWLPIHSHPVPFKCSITSRSEKHRLLLQDWVEVWFWEAYSTMNITLFLRFEKYLKRRVECPMCVRFSPLSSCNGLNYCFWQIRGCKLV